MAKPLIIPSLATRGPGDVAEGHVFQYGGDGPLTAVEFSLDGTTWHSQIIVYKDVDEVRHSYGFLARSPEPITSGVYAGVEWSAVPVRAFIDTNADPGYYEVWVRAYANTVVSDPVKLTLRCAEPGTGHQSGGIELPFGGGSREDRPQTMVGDEILWQKHPSGSGQLDWFVVRDMSARQPGNTSQSSGDFPVTIQAPQHGGPHYWPLRTHWTQSGKIVGIYGESSSSSTRLAAYSYDPYTDTVAGPLSLSTQNRQLRLSAIRSDGTWLIVYGSGSRYHRRIVDPDTLDVLDAYNWTPDEVHPWPGGQDAQFGDVVYYVERDGSTDTGEHRYSLFAWDLMNLGYWKVCDLNDVTDFGGFGYTTESGAAKYAIPTLVTGGDGSTLDNPDSNGWAYILVRHEDDGTEIGRTIWRFRIDEAEDPTIEHWAGDPYGTETETTVSKFNLLIPPGGGGTMLVVGEEIFLTVNDSGGATLRPIWIYPSALPVMPPGDPEYDPEPPTPPIPTSLTLDDPQVTGWVEDDGEGGEIHVEPTWRYFETDETSTWQVELYTVEPEEDGTGHTFEVLVNGEWVTTPVVNQVTQTVSIPFLGDGSGVIAGRLAIEQTPTGHTDVPAPPTGAAAACRLKLFLEPELWGRFEYTVEESQFGFEYLRPTWDMEAFSYPSWFRSRHPGLPVHEWPVAITVRARNAQGRASAPQTIFLSVNPVITGPTEPEVVSGDTDTDEDQSTSFTLGSDYPGDHTDSGDGFFTIRAHSDPDAPFDEAGWGDSVTVYDDTTGEVLGTLTLGGSPSKSNPRRAATFTPASQVSGSGTVALYAWDGDLSSVSPGETPPGYALTTLTLSVVERNDPPSAASPEVIPTFDEDGYVDVEITWTDPDYDPEDPSGSWSLELSAVGPNGPWRTDFIETDKIRVVIDPDDTDEPDDLTVDIRVEGKGSQNGDFVFWSRILDRSSDPELYGPTRKHIGTITPVDNTPTAPVPTTMPTIRFGEELATGTFTTSDPDQDDTAWTFQVAASPNGPWSASLSLGESVGTVAILDETTDDQQTQVTFAPVSSFQGRYHFYLRVTDNDGLTSPAQRITGVVASNGATADLVRVTRSTGAITLEPLCPINPLDLEITESLTGPGGGEVVVSALEIMDRAQALGLNPSDLLEKGHVEVHVYQDGALRAAGPIVGHETSIEDLTIRIDFDGLGSYLQGIMIESNYSAINKEQTAIMWELIDVAQQLPYGELGFQTGVATTSTNRTVEWEAGTYIAEALEELSAKLEGAEWWVDPDRTFRAQAIRGDDRRNEIVFTERNTIGLTEQGRFEDVATVARVDGDGVAGTAVAPSSRLAKYGRVGRHVRASQLGTTDAAENLAADIVAKGQSSPSTGRFTHVIRTTSPIQPWDYQVGDAVTIAAEMPAGYLRQDVRIINRRLRLVAGSTTDWLVDIDWERIADDGVIRRSRSRHNARLYDQMYDLMWTRQAA